MTNKQVVIDGIDVHGCECFSKYGHSCDLMRPFGFCSQWSNCYYKQLKRKEQECERWQAELADKASELQFIEEKIKPLMKRPDDLDCYDLEWIVVAFVDEFNQLKVENEELKKQVNDLLHKPEIQDKILWKIDNEALLGSKDAYIYKLEKTLTEIKKMVEQGVKIHDDIIVSKQILQKIKECEVNNDMENN